MEKEWRIGEEGRSRAGEGLERREEEDEWKKKRKKRKKEKMEGEAEEMREGSR